MKITSAEFEVSAPDLRTCPTRVLPEFALIGRSNVGKSSLVNLLTDRRGLAMVSDTPGKTKLINFFVLNRKWSLVDLPGYGYAKVGKQRQAEFNAAVADYLTQRPNLRRVFVLIDSRLPPQPIDLEFLRWLQDHQVPYAVVFTKIDKQSATQTKANLSAFTAALTPERIALPEVLTCSAKTKVGRNDILKYIEASLKP